MSNWLRDEFQFIWERFLDRYNILKVSVNKFQHDLFEINNFIKIWN